MLAWWKTITLLFPGRFGYFDLVLVQNLKQCIENSPEEGMESVQTTVDCQAARPTQQKGLNCLYLPSSYLTREEWGRPSTRRQNCGGCSKRSSPPPALCHHALQNAAASTRWQRHVKDLLFVSILLSISNEGEDEEEEGKSKDKC